MTILTQNELERMPAAKLKDMAKRGILRVVNNGPALEKHYTEYPEYKKHAKLKGVKITIQEASREYGVPAPTISRWVSRNLITVLQRTAREIYLDRADMAYCAEIHRQNSGAGKWLFNQDRTPYVATTKQG